MNMRDYQEIFDRSARHIIKQGKPSFKKQPSGRWFCMYQSPKGLGCGIAPFIHNYSPELEGNDILSILDQYSSRVEPLLLKVAPLFLKRLQKAHDKQIEETEFIYMYKQKMEYLAEYYGLSTSVLYEKGI